MRRPVKVAFASCKPELIALFVHRFAELAPHLELFVVSEFPPPTGRWIPWRVDRSWSDNIARCRAALKESTVRLSAVVLQPGVPYRRLRWLGWWMSPIRTLFYNTHLDHFTLRSGGLIRHAAWRVRELIAFQLHPGGDVYTWLWRVRHPSQLRRPLDSMAARIAGRLVAFRKQSRQLPPVALADLPQGISVVIPSRNGRPLLERLLPHVVADANEIIVMDNGSSDGTAAFLADRYPEVRVLVDPAPLSFARAVNRGIRAATFSHVCLLNNDMVPEAGFLPALRLAFDRVPDLFCATAQIFFPPGKRREETGKAVMRPPPRHRRTTEFPVHCIEPLPGENLSYVLYGSGGCSLYDTAKLRAVGGIGEAYEPAYVEDLDAGVRGWQHGWPTVFVADARTVHDHRTTTSKYYTEAELAVVLERNYLRFLAGTVQSPEIFTILWNDAVERLNLKAALEHDAAARVVLSEARHAGRWLESARGTADDEALLFALGTGDVAVFPGRTADTAGETILIASCYIPFPLSHGGAVRMFNLMRRAAKDFRQILVTFVDELHTPPDELLDICVEIVQVRRHGSHRRADTGRPDVVQEFDSPAFLAALKQTLRKWSPALVQLEFTQMAQYAGDCHPAKTLLVEHDVTIDLYRQLLSVGEDYDLRQQLERWLQFEKAAWRQVDCVITMSERDRRSLEGTRCAATLPNGVDLARFTMSNDEPEPGRLLFIGSFAHLPNLLALDFFLAEVWPLLSAVSPVLHVIAGSNHEFYFDRARDRLRFSLSHSNVQVDGFVADVRPAYRRAAVVIAPLLASAGTNIKIMEAMAMGKAIVSTPGGVNGLHEIEPGRDLLVASEAQAFANAVTELLSSPAHRRTLEKNARRTAERVYDWDAIAEQQKTLYRTLLT